MMSSNGSDIGVSSKTGQVVGVDIGLRLKLQNQSRSFGRSAIDDADGDGNGPTYSSCGSGSGIDIITDIYDVAAANSSSSGLRVLQPFHVSCPPPLHFYKSSALASASGGMATTAMGYPFTAAQWKELERQAMIYKYMVASLPVPPHLLYSTFPTGLSFAPVSYLVGNGLNLSWSGNSKDAEPGRCRRTDGKKWRCSRDVAPNQKYCERHMHRGRPRSRKPVELLSNFPISAKNNNPPKNPRLDASASTSNPKPAGSSLPSTPPSKAPTFGHPMGTNVNPFEDSRWNEEQQWQQLVQANMNSLSSFQHQFEGVPLNLNSQADFSSESDMRLLKRPLLDAWSMGVTGGSEDNGVNDKSSLVPSRDSNGNAIDEDRCEIHMGLGVIDSWLAPPSSPGGPLAEVLRPSPFTAPCKSTSDAGENDLVTPPATSSPSGVLQKTFASLSDSSGSNSPTCHNSKTNSDMPFRWLN